jgi:hypothetical protein
MDLSKIERGIYEPAFSLRSYLPDAILFVLVHDWPDLATNVHRLAEPRVLLASVMDSAALTRVQKVKMPKKGDANR